MSGVLHRLRLAWRAALSTAGLRRSGFFIPLRYAPTVRPLGYGAVERLFVGCEAEFTAWLDRVEAYADDLAGLGGQPPAPRFAQDWFPRLDAAMAYTLVRELRPRRVVEVGCGHSTRFLARAIGDGSPGTRLDCIDPAPRASLRGLPVRHHACSLGEAPAALFRLAPGDLLFVDSSHVAMPGTDVDQLFNDILPALPAGVVVHLHDIFLPDPYPQDWDWRGYNEQLLVASWLLAGGLRPLFSSRWAVTRMAQRVARSAVSALPLLPGARESSLWAVLTEGRPSVQGTETGRVNT